MLPRIEDFWVPTGGDVTIQIEPPSVGPHAPELLVSASFAYKIRSPGLGVGPTTRAQRKVQITATICLQAVSSGERLCREGQAEVILPEGAGVVYEFPDSETNTINLATKGAIEQGVHQLITTRDYLLRAKTELEGYGFYSYVLLSQRPNTSEQLDKYVLLFKAYSAVLEPTKEFLTMGQKESELNSMYWLLDLQEPLNLIAKRAADANWEFFVTYYDYARAQSILSRLKMLGKEGPFLVGYVAPLAGPNITKYPERDDVLVFWTFPWCIKDHYVEAFHLYQARVARDPQTWKHRFDLLRIRLALRSLLNHYSESIVSLVGLIYK